MKPEQIIKAAWWSVALGVGMELVLLGLALAAGRFPAVQIILAETVQKVSWSVFVCVGLVLGSAAAKASRGTAMGLAGFLAAPAGFYVAKILHIGTLKALDAASGAGAGVPGPLAMAAIKAIEYGWLGAAIAVLGRRRAKAGEFALTGFVTGVVTAGLILWLSLRPSAPIVSTSTLVLKSVNEILFPIGCSLVLYAAGSSK